MPLGKRYDHLAIEDISEEYQPLAALLSIPAFLALAEQYGGYQLYIPKLKGILKNNRDEAIRAEFTGFNYKELARKYGLSPRYIRQIVKPAQESPPSSQARGQRAAAAMPEKR